MVAFGSRVRDLERLDVAILNAGVKQLEYVKTATGHEQNVQVNHLGTALLSLFALDPLRRTAKATGQPSRLTVTTSEMLWWTKFEESSAPNILRRLDEPESMKDKDARDRYSVSKWLTMAFARQLATRVDAKEVIINGVNPGFCKSSLHRHDGGSVPIVNTIGWSSEQGGHCLTDAAIGHPESHKGYISEQKVKP
jgi:NAD(P)-dependent dehydrogenase (short-subunit alcohol dehydrogenase family)